MTATCTVSSLHARRFGALIPMCMPRYLKCCAVRFSLTGRRNCVGDDITLSWLICTELSDLVFWGQGVLTVEMMK